MLLTGAATPSTESPTWTLIFSRAFTAGNPVISSVITVSPLLSAMAIRGSPSPAGVTDTKNGEGTSSSARQYNKSQAASVGGDSNSMSSCAIKLFAPQNCS